jgi:NAD(P)-dependent dehydrogenase (short-subunit alcohol dehydrogenase family)
MIQVGEFAGRVALVTGAGGGIGLATADAFTKAGVSVVLVDSDEELVHRTAENLSSEGLPPWVSPAT